MFEDLEEIETRCQEGIGGDTTDRGCGPLILVKMCQRLASFGPTPEVAEDKEDTQNLNSEV